MESGGFNDRMNALLSSIDSVKVELNNPSNKYSQNPDLKRAAPTDDENKDTFKIPVGPPPSQNNRRTNRNFAKLNRTPDYIQNPHKWTKYNLEDTPEVNDRNNKCIALSVMNELNSRKLDEKEIMDDSDNDQKIIFKKPCKDNKNLDNNSSTSNNSSESNISKDVIETEKETKKKIKKSSKSEIKLDHLLFVDEDD